MTRVVVYTADIGGHDDVHGHVDQMVPEDWEVSWAYLSNDEGRANEAIEKGWAWVSLGAWSWEREVEGDRLLGRWAKCHPHVLFPGADMTIWVDASMEITGPRFVQDAANQTSRMMPYAAFRHPDRTSVQEEIEAAAPMAKYDHARHVEMVEEFEAVLGGEIESRLYAMGVLVRRNRPDARAIDHLVWTETLRWSSAEAVALDQLILPFVLDLLRDDLIPLDSPAPQAGCWGLGDLWSNDWFTIDRHRRET